jgi:hypothetical protein
MRDQKTQQNSRARLKLSQITGKRKKGEININLIPGAVWDAI